MSSDNSSPIDIEETDYPEPEQRIPSQEINDMIADTENTSISTEVRILSFFVSNVFFRKWKELLQLLKKEKPIRMTKILLQP